MFPRECSRVSARVFKSVSACRLQSVSASVFNSVSACRVFLRVFFKSVSARVFL